MNYFNLTDEEERHHEEVAHYHGKRIWSEGLLGVLKRKGLEAVHKEIDKVIHSEVAKTIQVDTDGRQLMESIMSLPKEAFKSGEDIDH